MKKENTEQRVDTGTYFSRMLLNEMVDEITVDLSATPYFFNERGRPHFTALNKRIQRTLLKTEAVTAADLSCLVPIRVRAKNQKKTKWGVITELDFPEVTQSIVYQPFKITPELAAAFGMHLIGQGKSIKIENDYDIVSYCEYKYGKFAAYANPYLDTAPSGQDRTLFPTICTDLEGHNFPHLFVSCDPYLDLVISVGIYDSKQQTLVVADLWIPAGYAVYIPPQKIDDTTEKIFLHNNRNSANACWGSNVMHEQIKTHTLLDTQGRIHWFWNRLPTEHPQL